MACIFKDMEQCYTKYQILAHNKINYNYFTRRVKFLNKSSLKKDLPELIYKYT